MSYQADFIQGIYAQEREEVIELFSCEGCDCQFQSGFDFDGIKLCKTCEPGYFNDLEGEELIKMKSFKKEI